MSDRSRKEILAKIRRISSRREFPYDREAVEASVDPRPKGRTLADHVALFCKRQQELGGQVHEAASVTELVDALVRRLSEIQDGPVWVEAGLELGGESILDRLRSAGVPNLNEATEPEDSTLWKQLLADASVGVTGANWLLAETGSVVLVHRPGRPRMLSLLPKHHFVVASVSQLVPNLDEVIPLLERVHADADFAAVTIVTGSSRTADIEKILIKGVHGPQNLEVFLLVGSPT
ncbi:MAG: hypothetical protein GXO73_10315 [Calditrichaeota bacterium]|nr:hypothetical protein [Calditrichota bacterium]